jgi:hypothetical protein
LVRRFYDSGRIAQKHLKIIAVHNSQNAVAGGLRLGSNNGKPLAHKSVHQRAFAHVWVSNNIYESGLVFCHFFGIDSANLKLKSQNNGFGSILKLSALKSLLL